MRARLAYPAWFLALLLVAAVIQWPAAWLAPWLDSASGGKWRLAAASGSLWHGAGALLVRTGSNAAWRNVQSITWNVHGSELLRGRLAIDIAPEQGETRVVATPGGFAVEQLDATLPVSEIASLLPGALGRYGWTGMLHARGAQFACGWTLRECHGEIELLWNDAAVAEVPGPALGDYRLHLIGDGPVLRVDLATLRGRLQFSGNGEIAGGGKLHFRGEASAQPSGNDSQESLNSLLGTLGRPAGGGKYLIEYRES